MTSIDLLSLQAIYTDKTAAAAVMASGSNVTAAVSATATVTVTNFGSIAGNATITVNGTVFTNGVDWTAATDNNTTAASIAAIATLPAGITASATANVVTFTVTAKGTAGNADTMASSDATNLAVSGAHFAGGIDAKFTKTAHGLTTGLVGQMTTSSALPTGLITSTNYYVIVIDANNFALASSLVNANAGTRIQFSTTGTGNQTFTPISISFVVKLQAGNDGINWTDISGDTVTISSAGSTLWNIANPAYAKLNIVVTATSGILGLTVLGNAVRQWYSK